MKSHATHFYDCSLFDTVSGESPTNEEENPRYRGGHIPSRVFRMLNESGTDSILYNSDGYSLCSKGA
jgi:hypothetical protein